MRQLLSQVWRSSAVDHSHYLRIDMEYLRQRAEKDPACHPHLLTEIGMDYHFTPYIIIHLYLLLNTIPTLTFI